MKKENKLTGILICLALIFPVLPGYTMGFLDGRPLGHPFDVVWWVLSLGLIALTYEADHGFKRKMIKYLGMITIAKLILFLATLWLPQHGVVASYYAAEDPEGQPVEYSIEYPSLEEATRIDPNINFTNESFSFFGNPFPTWFFNDYERFKRSGSGGDIHVLPFSAHYEGYLYIPKTIPTLYFFLYTDGNAGMLLDGERIINANANVNGKPFEARTGESELTAGLHEIELEYFHSEYEERVFKLSWIKEWYEDKQVIAPKYFFTEPVGAVGWVLDRCAYWLSSLLYLLLGAWLYCLIKERVCESKNGEKLKTKDQLFLLGLIYLGAIFIRIMLLAQYPDFNFLHLGNDDRTFVTLARDILENHDWANIGLQSGTYYYVILYRYALAIGFWLLGESIIMITFMQAVLLGLAGGVTYYLIQNLTKRKDLAFAGAFIMLFFPDNWIYVWTLFSNGTFLLISSLALFLWGMQQTIHKNRHWSLLGSGFILGLAVLMRANMILVLPLTLGVLLWWGWKDRFKSLSIWVLLFLVGFMIATAPFGLRNYMVAGEYTISSTLEPNLIRGNPFLETYIFNADEHPIIDALIGDEIKKSFFGYAVENPWEMTKVQLDKLADVVGLPNSVTSFDLPYFLLWLLGISGYVMFWMHKKENPHARRQALFLFLVILALAFPLVVVHPWRTRFYLPFIPLLSLGSLYAVSLMAKPVYRALKSPGLILLAFLFFALLNIHPLFIIGFLMWFACSFYHSFSKSSLS